MYSYIEEGSNIKKNNVMADTLRGIMMSRDANNADSYSSLARRMTGANNMNPAMFAISTVTLTRNTSQVLGVTNCVVLHNNIVRSQDAVREMFSDQNTRNNILDGIIYRPQSSSTQESVDEITANRMFQEVLRYMWKISLETEKSNVSDSSAYCEEDSSEDDNVYYEDGEEVDVDEDYGEFF